MGLHKTAPLPNLSLISFFWQELMRLMGMNRWLMWLGWFLHALVVVLLVASIGTIMITVSLHSGGKVIPPIILYSDPSFVWVMLTLYGICAITFCLAVSTLFSRRECAQLHPSHESDFSVIDYMNIPTTMIWFHTLQST